MKTVLILAGLLLTMCGLGADGAEPAKGVASWYGEAHRGKPMANGRSFNPDRLTAASWFYPLGTRVKVTLQSRQKRSVLVTITDRGPARRLVREGRIIDLTRAAFEKLDSADLGLIAVTVEPLGPTP
jgi:rare lipoprotein A